MKKITALLMAVLMLCTLFTACGSTAETTQSTETAETAEASESSALAKVKEAGKLTVATSPDFPPFESLENGEVVGIEIDILQLICEQLGVSSTSSRWTLTPSSPVCRPASSISARPASPLLTSARRTFCSPIPTASRHRPLL